MSSVIDLPVIVLTKICMRRFDRPFAMRSANMAARFAASPARFLAASSSRAALSARSYSRAVRRR